MYSPVSTSKSTPGCSCFSFLILGFRNSDIRQHVQTARGLFPHRRIVRKSEMTAKGLVVTEEEEISGMPSSSSPTPGEGEPGSPTRKSPISELLYVRWLEGLRAKWPSIL